MYDQQDLYLGLAVWFSGSMLLACVKPWILLPALQTKTPKDLYLEYSKRTQNRSEKRPSRKNRQETNNNFIVEEIQMANKVEGTPM